MIRLSILGSQGKMGKRVHELALNDPEVCVARTYSRQDTDLESAFAACDVAIDFTSPQATLEHLNAALKAKKPLVLGTTGHSEKELKAIEIASQTIPILYSPNFSLGIALCMDTAQRISKALGSDCSIEILETHHVHKKDSPSGTALALASATGKEASISSIRTGEVIGEHTVIFKCGLERLELKHTAHSRDAFALGAIKGAKFLLKQPPGLYKTEDLIQ